MQREQLSPLKKMILVLAVGGLLSLVLLVGYLTTSLRQTSIDRWLDDSFHAARQLAGWIDEELSDAREQLEAVSQLDAFRQVPDPSLIDREVNGIPVGEDNERRKVLSWLLTQNDHGFNVAFVLLPNGDHYLSHPYYIQKSLKTYNLGHRAYFKQATQSKQVVLSDVIQGADGIPAVVVDVPVINAQGEITSHLGGVFYLQRLQAMLNEQGRKRIGEHYFLLDRSGKEIVSSGFVGTELDEMTRLLSQTSAWKAQDTTNPYITARIGERDEDRKLLLLIRLESGWTLGVSSELNAVARLFSKEVASTAMIAAILLSFMFAISSFLVRRIGLRWQQAEQAVVASKEHLELRVAERTQALEQREQTINRARQRLQNILHATRAGTWEWDIPSGIITVNERCATMLGYTLEEVEPVTVQFWVETTHPEDWANAEPKMEAHLRGETDFFVDDLRVRHRSGRWVWVLTHGQVTEYSTTGKALKMAGTFTEITDRKQAEEKLQMLASVFSHAREGIMITDPAGIIIDVNETFCGLTGYSRDEAIGRNPNFLSSGKQDQTFYSTMWQALLESGHWSGEIWNRKKSGEVYAEMLTISQVCDQQGKVQNYVALFSDITRNKQNEQRLEHIAHYDALTELPNRVLLSDRLQQALLQADRGGSRVAVVYLDLDGFKQINDNHGHEQGDRLLVEVARRMRSCLRDCDTIARLGGDEFVAVLTGLKDSDDSIPLLERILAAASEPVINDGLQLTVSASLGVVFYPQEEELGPDQLLRQADQAMYQAKLEGRNRYHFFNPEHDRAAKGLHESMERIRLAVEREEFTLFYQPKVNMRSGELLGLEALIRWQHPERGLLLPGEFLPVIEGQQLMVTLGDWVLESALQQMSRWHEQGLKLHVSVNISSLQLQKIDFSVKIQKLLSAFPQVSPEQLQLEILESSALEDIVQVSEVMQACNQFGVSFSLDDFGTGYSSLTYLKRLPASELKIDRSFVRDMLDDPDDLSILQGVLGLASAFGREVIAEGVESVEHGRMLLQLGCDHAQGFGIGRPMPAAEVSAWISQWTPDPCWQEVTRIAPERVGILAIIVEHRAWLHRLEEYLQGARNAPPELSSEHCRLGIWLERFAQDNGVLPEELGQLNQQHTQIHHDAIRLIKAVSEGHQATDQDIIALRDLRDQVVSQLQRLAETETTLQ